MSNRRTKLRNGNSIPPPPRPEQGYDALIEYFTKYSTQELEKAGYLEDASAEDMREAQLAATYDLLRDNGLSVKLSRKECERLVLLAVEQDVSVDELVKKWLKERLRLEGRRADKTKATGSRV